MSVVDPSFLVLFDLYKRHASGGITKNKIYHIIKELLSRASETQLKELLEQHPALYEDYFTTIKAANYANTKHYNKNESSAFDIGLIAQLTKKEEATLLGVSKIVGKDLKRILKKYSTKIASFQNNSAFALEEESNFFQYNVLCDTTQTENIKSSEGNGGFNLSIGKNNISIPVLQLPDRYQTAEAQSKQSNGNPNSPDLSPTELHQSPLTTTDAVIEPKEVLVIEEEEVIVLTSKINSDMGLNLSEVIEEMKERQNLEKKLEKIQVSPVKDPSPRG